MNTVSQSNRSIDKAMRLGQSQFIVLEGTDDGASAFCTEINGKVVVRGSHTSIQMEVFFQFHECFIGARVRIHK